MHLRTVHFTLVVIALALVSATVLSQPHALLRARSDLALIDQAQQNLNKGWLSEYCDDYLIDRVEGIHLDGAPLFVHVDQFQGTRSVVFEGYPGTLWTLPRTSTQKNRTIGEFVTVWNELSEPYAAEIPYEFEAQVYVRDTTVTERHKGRYKGEYSATNAFSGSEVIQLESGESENLFRLRPYKLRRDVKEAIGLPTYDLDWAYYAESNDVAVEVPVKTHQVPIEGIQTALLGHQRKGVERKRFDEAFPELHRYAAVLSKSEVPEVRSYLNGLMDVSEGSIKVFGVGIEAGNIRRYGPLVLLIVQVYLLLHLRHFCSRFGRLAHDVDVPWIGLYQDGISRLAFVITVVVIPPTVAVALLSSRGFDEYTVPVGAFVIASAVATCWTWAAIHRLEITLLRRWIGRLTTRSTGAAVGAESESEARQPPPG